MTLTARAGAVVYLQRIVHMYPLSGRVLRPQCGEQQGVRVRALRAGVRGAEHALAQQWSRRRVADRIRGYFFGISVLFT